MGPGKDKHQTHRLKFYTRAVIESESLTRGRAIKEETIAINNDWIYNQLCVMSHNIHAN